jgi:predicted dehydrogenase
MHAPQAIQVLRAGKDVYSAVPAGVSIDEIAELVRTVAQTGRIYMMGETSYYYPSAVYCRQQFARGAFGHVVYAEGEYLHDFDHGLYDVMKARAGERWREEAGIPPMHYPTHSVAMAVSVTGAHATHVSCHGFVDRHADGLFRAAANRWHNCFSDETALFRMSDGSSFRVNEFRRIGHPGVERGSIWGTEGSFEMNLAGAAWATKHEVVRLDDKLRLIGVAVDPAERGREPLPAERTFRDTARVHNVDRLPREFAGLPNSHSGSHQFLVDDFVQACVTRKPPPVNVWLAARLTVPGLVAHESAMRDGELLEVPDFGERPA